MANIGAGLNVGLGLLGNAAGGAGNAGNAGGTDNFAQTMAQMEATYQKLTAQAMELQTKHAELQQTKRPADERIQ